MIDEWDTDINATIDEWGTGLNDGAAERGTETRDGIGDCSSGGSDGVSDGPRDPDAIHRGLSLVVDATMVAGPDNCPFLVNADDLEDDVKNINGRGRDYLLEARYEHTFEFDETLALALTAGLLDASQYIDHNALADDEIIQFMNEVFVSRFFLPTYDPGIRAGLSGAGWHTDLVWMDAATETPGVDPDGYHFLGVDFGFSLQLPMGEGHYDILLQSTDRAMTRRSGSERSTRIRGAGVSVDQAVSENLDVFVRLGANNEEAAALVHRALYSGGVRLKGQALALPRWTLGAAFAYLDGSGDQVGDVRRTRVFETFGRYALTADSNISLDIQYVADDIRGGLGPDTWIVGVRANASF